MTNQPEPLATALHSNLRLLAFALVLLCALTMITMQSAEAQTYSVIHSFNLLAGDGAGPDAGLILDSHGNLFGTTFAGGTSDSCSPYKCGTVFEMSPANGGGWTETVIHNLGSIDGHPGAPLTMHSHGNLYGTGAGFSGDGAVFELVPGSNGSWREVILHQFRANGDGSGPGSAVTLDSSGLLYGTTSIGGKYGEGTAYSVNPHLISGESVIHSFLPSITSGYAPSSTYLQIINGNIYGTTLYGGPGGGPYGGGTVFQLTRSGSGWTATTLYAFKGASHGDGSRPIAGLLFDGTNNFYGVTQTGGTASGNCQQNGCGTVYKLTHNADGSWSESVLYSFQGETDGNGPWGNLIFDRSGNIYGTTYAGGVQNGYGNGTVFKLTPGTGGHWTETVLARLPGGAGGSIVPGGVVMDSAGNIYGTAQNGGAYGYGVVWEITP